jgi:hypothetical protein
LSRQTLSRRPWTLATAMASLSASASVAAAAMMYLETL